MSKRKKLKTSLKYSKQFTLEDRKLLYGLYIINVSNKYINFETFIAFAQWDKMKHNGKSIFRFYI